MIDIDKIVDDAFDKNLGELKKAIDSELYPDAFADEHSWLRVEAVILATVAHTKASVRDALAQFAKELD